MKEEPQEPQEPQEQERVQEARMKVPIVIAFLTGAENTNILDDDSQ